MSELFFAYGTLRPGATMHALIEGRVTVLGAATAPGRLVDLGHFPGLVDALAPDDRVLGELCEIPGADAAALLDVLDRYEGESFERVRRTVQGPSGAAEAWVYRWRGDPSGRPAIPGGDYLASRHSD